MPTRGSTATTSRDDRIAAHQQRRSVRRRSQPIRSTARISTRPDGGPVRTINIISRDNGVGLSTDMALLEQVLIPAGYDVQRVNYSHRVMRPCDVAIYLELFNPALVRYARKIVGVFNLEWFAHGWERYLPKFDQLWAKSREAVQVYDDLGLASRYTGFASRDMLDTTERKLSNCLHVRGHSNLKNTEAVLEAWRRDPDLPPLVVVSSTTLRAPENVTVLPRVEHERLVNLMNTRGIHLCPSRSEGWGHYITEGMTTGATVITTDASPMNEHIQFGRGILIPSTGTHQRWRVVEHDVNPDDIITAVRLVVGLPDEQRVAIGERAREFILGRNRQFHDTVLALIKELLCIRVRSSTTASRPPVGATVSTCAFSRPDLSEVTPPTIARATAGAPSRSRAT